MVNAQEWLQSNYSKGKNKTERREYKKGITEIKATLNEEGLVEPFTPLTPVFPGREPTVIGDHKLEGKLKIESYPNLETVSLLGTEGITELTIENCPNLKELNVAGNKITQIIGLDKCPKLEILNTCVNKIAEIDLSKNTALKALLVSNNTPQTKIKGLEKLSKLVLYNNRGENDGLPQPTATTGGGDIKQGWESAFLQTILGSEYLGVKDGDEKAHHLPQLSHSIKRAIDNLKSLGINADKAETDKSEPTGMTFLWEKDWEILAEVLKILDWEDIKKNWNEEKFEFEVEQRDGSKETETSTKIGYKNQLSNFISGSHRPSTAFRLEEISNSTLEGLISTALLWKGRSELDKVGSEVISLAGIDKGLFQSDPQDFLPKIKRRASVLKEVHKKVKNDLGIDIYAVPERERERERERESNWEAKIDNLIEVKKWFEKVFGVDINDNDWQDRVVELLGQTENKEGGDTPTTEIFTLEKAHLNTNLNLLDLIKEWREKSKQSDQLADLVKALGHEYWLSREIKDDQKTNPDLEKHPHPFDKEKVTYWSDFIKERLGTKNFSYTTFSLTDLMNNNDILNGIVFNLGYDISSINANREASKYIKENIVTRKKGSKKLSGIVDEANRYQDIVNEKNNTDILTDSNFDQIKLDNLREKAKEANKETVILEWKGQGVKDETIPYQEFQIVTDDKIKIVSSENFFDKNKKKVDLKTFREGEIVKFYSTFFMGNHGFEKGGFFELYYPCGELLADSSKIIQGTEWGGYELKRITSQKRTLILEWKNRVVGEKNYETFAIIGSDDRADENYGHGESININFDYILPQEEIEKLKSAQKGDIFQFSFDGFLEFTELDSEAKVFSEIFKPRNRKGEVKWQKITSASAAETTPDNEEEILEKTISTETEKLREDIFATLPDLENGWEKQEAEGEEGEEKKIISGYKERLTAIDNPNFEKLLRTSEEVDKAKIPFFQIKHLGEAAEIVEKIGFEEDIPEYDPKKHGNDEDEFMKNEGFRRAEILKQVHDKLKNDFFIDIYQDKDWAAKMANLLEVKEWLEKIFEVDTTIFDLNNSDTYTPTDWYNPNEWKRKVGKKLGKKETKEELLEHETDSFFTFADAKNEYNRQLDLSELIEAANEGNKDRELLGGLLEVLGYDEPTEEEDENKVWPDRELRPDPFIKNRLLQSEIYWSLFKKNKMGGKSFADTNQTLEQLIKGSEDLTAAKTTLQNVKNYLGEDDLDNLPAKPNSVDGKEFLKDLIEWWEIVDDLMQTDLDIWTFKDADGNENGFDKNKVKDYVDKKAAAEKYEQKLKVLLADGETVPKSVPASSDWEEKLVRKGEVGNNNNDQQGNDNLNKQEEVLKKTLQDSLTAAKGYSLTTLQDLRGDLDDADINNQVQANDADDKTDNWGGKKDWQDKLQANDPTLTNAQELSIYVQAVSAAIETLKEKKKEEELNKAKKNALTGFENNLLKDATITDADINREINKIFGSVITGANNWKNFFKDTDNRIDDYEKLANYSNAVAYAISQAKINQDLKTAKQKALDDLTALKGTLDDRDIINKAEQIENNIILGGNWKTNLGDINSNIKNAEGLTHYANIITQAIIELKGVNEGTDDLKAAKAVALTYLENLRGTTITDGQIKAAANAVQQNTISRRDNWKTKLQATDNQLSKIQKLTKYINIITDAINELKGTGDIKNAKIHAANSLNNFKGTLDDNEITAAAEVIEPTITNAAVWTRKLLANDTTISNAEQLAHYVKIITQAISKCQVDHNLKQAKAQALATLQQLAQTAGLADGQINTKIGLAVGANWHDKLQQTNQEIKDARELARYVDQIIKAIEAEVVAKTAFDTTKGERDVLENQVKLVRTELGLGNVLDTVANPLTAPNLLNHKKAANSLARRESQIKTAINVADIPLNWQTEARYRYNVLRTKINGNPTGTLPANWENDLVKKADLTAAKGKLNTLKTDLGVIKNDNSIDTARVQEIRNNEVELNRVNNNIIARIKAQVNLGNLIKLNLASNKDELDNTRLGEIETILATPPNAAAGEVAKYKNKLQGLGIATGQEKADDPWENELMNKKPLTQAGYSDLNVALTELTNLKNDKTDYQSKLSQQEEHCRKEKEALQAQIEQQIQQKEQELLKFMVEQLKLNLTGDKYERQQVLAEIQKLIVKPDTNQENNLVNLRQQIVTQEKEIKKLREQDKENHPTSEVIKERAEKILKDLGLENSTYQTELTKITSLSELTDFYQQVAKKEISKAQGEKNHIKNWNIVLWLLFVGSLLISTFLIVKIKGNKSLGKKGK